ncbi:hypothetical protein FOMPIDRAFT_87459 [Fomitopsis schrenkii]|uniref:Uncharacterized protein n=1 Tax=Fomitopsis schrenkii TaxID=2126942 RepID=S8F966_FOMSC|nr:hypothetical protein FOMPIDRAFT_87459 [Fomitopsis schrenkii]
MSAFAPNPISPSFLISSNAAQEFIALQSAEIARLRADVDQLKAQKANWQTQESERGGNGRLQAMFDKSAVTAIKEHISAALQELVAGLRNELVDRAADRRDSVPGPQEDSLMKEIREEVTQCKNEISGLKDQLGIVADQLRICAEGALQASNLAKEEVARHEVRQFLVRAYACAVQIRGQCSP